MINRLDRPLLVILMLALVAGLVGLGVWWWISGGWYADILTPSAPPGPVPPPRPGLTITTDPRIELLSVVQYLSGYDERLHLLSQFDSAYKQDIEATFGPYRQPAQRAVQVFESMSQKSFSFDAPPSAMLYFSSPPELQAEAALPNPLIERGGGRAPMGEFISALRDFARDTHFMAFYEQHQPFYTQIVAQTAAEQISEQQSEVSDLALIEAYYGTQQHSYTIILAPLFHPGGYGPNVTLPDGSQDIYSIIGPNGLNDQGQPVFGASDSLRSLVWHEFGHSFVNPLTALYYRPKLAQYEPLYEPIKDPMKKQAYNSWQIAVNEHIVRAVVIRLIAQDMGEEAAQAAQEVERDRGFAYIDRLVKKLREYEAQRDQYPTLSDFYPRLIEAFGEVVK